MDLAYWGFRKWPFTRNNSGQEIGTFQDEALARMLFLVDERRRCGLLTGASGTGKSRLLEHVKSYSLRRGRHCIEIDATAVDGTDFVWQIAEQLPTATEQVGSTTRCWAAIREQFAALALVNVPIVVTIDHFDLVEFSVSQVIQRLMHLADSTHVDLTVLIAARQRFTAPLLLDDIDLTVELQPWTLDETDQFIQASTRDAGATVSLFSDEAIREIQETTGGIPAKVIWLCDVCLVAAYGGDQKLVTSDIVQAARDELLPRGTTTSSTRSGRPYYQSSSGGKYSAIKSS